MTLRKAGAPNHTSTDGAKVSRGVRLPQSQWDFLETLAERLTAELGVPVRAAAALSKLIQEEIERSNKS
jgi:hypothetical protein